jgi:SAM-dependent methyltransferase
VAGTDHVAAARAVYDVSADDYVGFVGTELTAATETTTDLALVERFRELLAAGAGRRVADLGCGPGRVAALLARNGLDVLGVDVSLPMLSAAQLAHPQIQFVAGRLDALPMTDASLAGIAAWYSVIYTPPDLLGEAFSEMHRVLAPGAYLLLAFQAGDGASVHREDAFGTGLGLTSYRHGLADVVLRLRRAGLVTQETALREPELVHETTPQAFVIASAS